MHRILIGFIAVASLVMTLTISGSIFAETIVLKSGQKIEGRVAEKTDKYIKVDIFCGSATYFFDQIESIDGRPISLREGAPVTTISSSSGQPTKTLQVTDDAFGTRQITGTRTGTYDESRPVSVTKEVEVGGIKIKKSISAEPVLGSTSTTKTLKIDTDTQGRSVYIQKDATPTTSISDYNRTLEIKTDEGGSVYIRDK